MTARQRAKQSRDLRYEHHTSYPEEVTETDRRIRRQPPYHVILLNDDDHTYDYVIRMLKELFGHPKRRAT